MTLCWHRKLCGHTKQHPASEQHHDLLTKRQQQLTSWLANRQLNIGSHSSALPGYLIGCHALPQRWHSCLSDIVHCMGGQYECFKHNLVVLCRYGKCQSTSMRTSGRRRLGSARDDAAASLIAPCCLNDHHRFLVSVTLKTQ